LKKNNTMGEHIDLAAQLDKALIQANRENKFIKIPIKDLDKLAEDIALIKTLIFNGIEGIENSIYNIKHG